ncbi:MAG: HD domain-containing protein [Ruminiclostridium sp.]|nr:HD domain-containing protein [Ruminiclostridium sp.]
MNLKFLRPLSAVISALAFITVTASAAAPEDLDHLPSGGGAAVIGKTNGVGYATELYNAENGLPTSDANVVFASSEGFIYIGGYSGLIRYDGTSFERQDSTSGVTSVNDIFEDSRNRLWIGTNDNGLIVQYKEFSKHYTYEDGLRSSSVRTVSEDVNGNILVGTTQGMYVIKEDLILYPLDIPQLDNSYILKLTADSAGNVCGCTKSGAFFRISDLRLTDYYNGNDFEMGAVTTILPDPTNDGWVCIGTDNGLLCRGSFDDNFTQVEYRTLTYTQTVTETDENGNVTESYDTEVVLNSPVNQICYASGYFWVLTDEAILYSDDRSEFHLLENIPLTSSIGTMAEDYEGNLWFSSSRQGVMKIVENKFTDITDVADLERKVVNSTCLHKGMLYIGTDSGLQIIDSDNNPVENDLTDHLTSTRIRCIMEDNSGNLWISTYTNDLGIVCYTADRKIIDYTEEKGILSNKTRCTVLAEDGTVLAATNKGLNVLKDGEVIKSIGEDQGLGNTVILTAAYSSDGINYLGTDGGGIYVIDGSKITHLGREDGLTSDVVMRIKRDDERGVFWIITSNSIEYMKDGIITPISSFPYTNNYDIYFDKTGNAWILASNGIYVASADDLIEKEKFDYKYYGIHDGIASVPTGNSFSCLDSSGDLYICSRDCVSRVNIDRYFENNNDIRFSITYIESGEQKYYPDDNGTVTLPSSAGNIVIYGYALTYSMHDPQIQYYLRGADSGAATVRKSDMMPVRYTNLHGGEYVYSLSLLDNSTNQVQQTTSIKIVKVRAFYEQFWFYLICGIVVIFAAVMGVRFYITQKTNAFLRKEQENRIFIRDMVEAFAKTIDVKDEYTNGHSKRVAEYTVMLTRELGYDENTVDKYYNIALLHDIGKIGIPTEVLNKPGKLTDSEFNIIKSHTSIGYNVLKDISIMPELADGAGSHHERPDGRGYPNGLKEGEIPRVAQIIAVADTFDAMYSNRPYRKRMNFEKVVSIIKEVSGTQLTPDVVDAFLRLVEKGEFKAPDDRGGGTFEDINNIHAKFDSSSDDDDIKIYHAK